MEVRKIVWLIYLILIPIYLGSQCTTPNPPAGLFCDPNLPNGAPLLCELDCLDGYTATMPPFDAMASQDGQPSPLCDSMNGGQPNNMSWFAFIAGSETIRLMVTPFSCSGGQDEDGVQAGIYGDCEGIEKLYCESEAQESPFEIGGPGFVLGQVYYFFIDGYQGSECMYTIDVLEGEQPFPLPPFTYTSDEYTVGETLCSGGTISTVVRGLSQEDVTYEYTIDPPTSLYPTGMHPETQDSIALWTFPESGTYEVCVTVTNGCDIESDNCITVTTDILADEVFTDVSICLEDLNNYNGPDLEDPNGDGIPGWQGNTTFFPGENRDTITTAEGCIYVQSININVIEPSSREDITIYTCEGDFPVTYEGTDYNTPVIGVNLSLDDRSVEGCDSLVRLTIEEIVVEADVIIQRCENGNAILEAVVTNQQPVVIDSMYVRWFDPMGIMITAPDEEIYEIGVSQSGIYMAEIVVFVDGVECLFVFDSEMVDLNNLRPSPPARINWLIEPCEDRTSVIYHVNRLTESGVTYNWTYPTDVASVVDNNVDSLIIDWGTSSGGEICVSVTNSCGTSDPSCETISILTIPAATIMVETASCEGDTIIVSSDGNAAWTHIWDFSDGEIISNNDLNGPGPHMITFNRIGEKTILLSLNDGDCVAPDITQIVNIVPRLEPPVVSCIASDSRIIFDWDDIADAVNYEIVTSTETIITDETFIELDGLSEGDMVSIEVRSLGALDCTHSDFVLESCVASCEDIGFSIATTEDDVCANRSEPITIDVFSSINDLDVSWSGSEAVDEFGLFNPLIAEAGLNKVIATVNYNGCVYIDSLEINVSELPVWTYEVLYPFCNAQDQAWIIVDPPPSQAPFEYYLNGDLVAVDTMVVNFEVPLVQAINSTGCESAEAIAVNGPQTYEFSLDFPAIINEGQTLSVDLTSNTDDEFFLDSMVIYGTVDGDLCNTVMYSDCERIDFIPRLSQSICLEIYYNGSCSFMNCWELTLLQVVSLYIPNVFSPNEDGNNDKWTIGSSINGLNIDKVRVFNRWGNMVYGRDNMLVEDTDQHWDGKMDGKNVPEGVYVYVIEYLNETGENVTETGSLTIIR
ncbi:MAG: gliding motility-associated C-terminal domain-containing protein [Saprospiraceae bacterium]|nr:gliding motility-associated C-terminal domain-containing protein [Saprospiraceae bacterium]